MKMNYQLRTKSRKNDTFYRALKITIGFFLGVLILSRILPNLFFNIFEPIAKPFWSIRESVVGAVTHNISFFSSKTALIDENNKLKQELLLATIDASKSDMILHENESLKSLFGSSTQAQNVIPGRIVTRFFESPFDVFYIETNENNVMIGDIVLGPGKVLLGNVSEVHGKIVKVKLYSEPNSETNAEIAKSGVPLKLVGAGAGNFTVVVPKDLVINPNDSVIVPGFHSHLIATVAHIEETEADSFKTLYLSYPLNIFELNWVEILHEQ